MQFSITFPDAALITRAFTEAPEMVLQELEIALGNSMEYLQREAQESTPTDLGTLRSAFATEVYNSPGLDAVIGTLSNPLPYAMPIEMGTRPHYPPLAPLESWVLRHLDYFPGIDQADVLAGVQAVARGIQRKIGAHGSPGYGMVRYALVDGKATVESEFAEAAQRIERRLVQQLPGGTA